MSLYSTVDYILFGRWALLNRLKNEWLFSTLSADIVLIEIDWPSPTVWSWIISNTNFNDMRIKISSSWMTYNFETKINMFMLQFLKCSKSRIYFKSKLFLGKCLMNSQQIVTRLRQMTNAMWKMTLPIDCNGFFKSRIFKNDQSTFSGDVFDESTANI